ncbi:hypothetical protein Bbelb_253160 [Branchiostoma belcheri]|nr:hypothetical protein Bbelb_253160 [Branchiostoma belcheri]
MGLKEEGEEKGGGQKDQDAGTLLTGFRVLKRRHLVGSSPRAAPVIHSWTNVKPERPTPKVRHCPPPKTKGSPGLNNRSDVPEPDTSAPTMDVASGSGPDPDDCMDTDTLAPDDSTATTPDTASEIVTSPKPVQDTCFDFNPDRE